jgi:hypothetical protein
LRSFKWHLNHSATGCPEPLNMRESAFVNDTFTVRRFHGSGKIGVYSHYFSATLDIGQMPNARSNKLCLAFWEE